MNLHPITNCYKILYYCKTKINHFKMNNISMHQKRDSGLQEPKIFKNDIENESNNSKIGDNAILDSNSEYCVQNDDKDDESIDR